MNYIKYHEIDENPETNKHLSEIIESLKVNGWQGLPLLADRDQLLNGCHRYTACEILGIEPVVHQLIIAESDDQDYRDYLIEQLGEANRTDDLYRAIKALHEDGLVDDLAFEIIAAENKGD